MSAAEKSGLRTASSPALRFGVDSHREFVVDDVIRGRVTFPAGTLDDFIITKQGGDPLYNFAAAVDDSAMAITHVIRGEEHLANTPKQLLIYEALGRTPPVFAHLPIILNEQRRKLSKRDGATFVNDYEQLGFLPEALVNFLALLGWSPGDNRELLTTAEMIAEFSLEAVVKHPAIFDVAKLSWMNKEYLKKTPVRSLAQRAAALLALREPGRPPPDPAYVEQVTSLLHQRVRTIGELLDQGRYFFAEAVDYAPEALAKHCSTPQTVERLRLVRDALAGTQSFSAADVEVAIRALAERTGGKAADYIHPLRVAVTGQAVSPGIFEVCAILGRPTVLRRVGALIEHLSGRSAAIGAKTT